MFHETYIHTYSSIFLVLGLPSPVMPPPLRNETRAYVENQKKIPTCNVPGRVSVP